MLLVNSMTETANCFRKKREKYKISGVKIQKFDLIGSHYLFQLLRLLAL